MVDEGLDGAIERSLAELGCPHCGARLRLLRVLSRRTATAVIATHCEGCGAVANRVCFTGDLLRQLHDRLAPAAHQGARVSPVAVGADDVLRMHDFLTQFNGDFLALFGSRGRR